MSAVDKIKQFFDEHAPELETLLGDVESTAEAIDPALSPVIGLFGELTDDSKTLITAAIKALHSAESTAVPASAAA